MTEAYEELLLTGYARYSYTQFEMLQMARYARHHINEEEVEIDGGEKVLKQNKNHCTFAVLRGFMY